MERILFENRKYGNTIFEIEEDRASLRWLFGLPMDESGKGSPERLLGLTDFDLGFGGCLQGDSKIVDYTYTDEELKLRFCIPGKKLEVVTDWKMDGELGVFSRKDTVTNLGE